MPEAVLGLCLLSAYAVVMVGLFALYASPRLLISVCFVVCWIGAATIYAVFGA